MQQMLNFGDVSSGTFTLSKQILAFVRPEETWKFINNKLTPEVERVNLGYKNFDNQFF